MIIDSHCHINSTEFDIDLETVLNNAKQVGVEKIFVPNVNLSSIEKLLPLLKQYPDFLMPMLGIHPCEIDNNYKEHLSTIYKYLDKTTYYAIGEIGLDYYWDKTHIESQKDAFEIQINWAIDLKIPINIHSRNSTEDAIQICKKYQSRGLKGVFHCFSGSLEQAKKIIDLGFYLGIGGVVTFKKTDLHQIVPTVGLANIVLETDAPYLAPSPFRGKRNEPSYLTYIVEKIADLCDTTPLEVKKQTTANALNLYKMT
jgi:TatD DNase family protein